MANELTLNQLQANCDLNCYRFIIQTIDDLWENYMFNIRNLNDADVDRVDLDDVKQFQQWLYQKQLMGFLVYLPNSNSAMQQIIKYCVQETAQ